MEEFAGFRFFRVLLEGFPTKLSLPRDLGKSLFSNVLEERDIKEATLISSANGEGRRVQLCKNGNSVYFGGERWHKLTLACGFGVGYFLVFRYRGSMIFTFRVFDTSTCERTISSSRSILDHLENLDINNVDDDNQVDEEPYPCWRAIPVRASKGKGLLVDDPKKRRGRPRKFHAVLDAAATSEQRPVGKSMCKISPNGRPYFEATMAPCNITKTNVHLYIPASFRDEAGISSNVTQLIIVDLKGRYRPVNVFHRNRFRTIYEYRETTIIKGWLDIVRTNNLKLGDKMIFELLSNEKDELIEIQMLKI